MKNVTQAVELLRLLPLFATTAVEALTDQLREAPEPVEVPCGGVIGEDMRALGVILEGRAEICSADSGHCVILREIGAPGVFGAASLFCDGPDPMSRIVAKTACRVLFFSLEEVRALLGRDEGFRDAYLAFLAGRVRFLNRKIRCFTAGSAERRLALWLCSEEGNTVTLPASLTALSDMLDIGRASLYRALDKLEGEGLIRREGRTITVISQDEILQKYQ